MVRVFRNWITPSHAAYRWLCGGAPINHDLLAEFRRGNAALLDRLLTQSVTGLIAEKLITLEELAIDGTKSLPSRKRGRALVRAEARCASASGWSASSRRWRNGWPS